MCGITGFCDFNKKLSETDLQNATECIRHRGPDDQGYAMFHSPKATVALGHRRLSILDLSAQGHQPMYSNDRNVVIILNGEIYNFREIRKELMAEGHSFHSDSDTEVIIKTYEKFGIDGVHKFIGMFAIVLYDQKQQQIYLVRDRAGVKPLHYFYKNDCLLFASELKSIYTYPVFEKNINEEAVSLFFKYAYISAPHTIFKNTYKVRPGHYIKIDICNKHVQEIKYYDILDYYNKPKLKISETDAIDEVEKLLISAFQYRMVSDVPVGVFLSGGYDSAVVASILQNNNAQKIKTFTIGFHVKKYNEAPYAKKVAEYIGTEHNEYYCTTKEAQDIFPLLADIYDEPFGDSSSIPTTLVSSFARKQVTVALSADGGDEIFAGYNRYSQLHKFNEQYQRTPGFLRSAIGSLVPVIPFKYIPMLRHKDLAFSKLAEILKSRHSNAIPDTLSKHYTDVQLRVLLPWFTPEVTLYDDIPGINNENDFLNKMLAQDYKTYMVDDILVKVDRATMSVGLEGREPFLDHRIIEFVSQLPSELKYHKGIKKYLLKKIAYKYIPENLLDRPKTGFGLPVYEWLKTDLKEYLFYYISEEQLSKHNFINSQKAIQIRDEFLAGKNNNETQIWLLLMFQMWWNKWM
ncbi:MAG: asparagine synthase (glutamine-hydrolyzing) [Ginsengibacter sp.]